MKKPEIIIGSRSSELAVIQVEEIKALMAGHCPGTRFMAKTFQSSGDIDKQKSLIENPQDDIFTDVLDRAVLQNDIDVAVHSAKDLPVKMAPGLAIFALTRSADETDAFVGRESLGRLPAGSKIGTSSELRREEVRALRPDCELVAIRGTIGERLQQLDCGEVDGLIVATAALIRLGLEGRITGIMPWEGFPLQGQLAVVGRRDDRAMRDIFAAIDVRREYGTVTLIGAGPGDPELITVKGINALREADCVLYDYLVHKGILEHAPGAEKIYVGKRKGDHTLLQRELCRLIRQQAIAGKRVARLKGGDPLIFGRGAEEIAYLRQYHIRVEVIPGVSSATGIPSGLGIPLTARNYSSSVAFLSAHQAGDAGHGEQEIDIPVGVDTLVFLMGLSKLEQIISAVQAAGRPDDTPVAIVSHGTRTDQSVLTGQVGNILERAQRRAPQPPALIIIGKSVSLYRPDTDQETIVYTGTHPEKYRSLGRVIHLPMIQISAADISADDVRRVTEGLSGYDLILLTSRFAVKYFVAFAARTEGLADALKQKDIVVIGRDTAQALMDAGYIPRYVAQEETARGMLALLKAKFPVAGQRILFPRSNLPNPFLKTELQKLGATVTELAIYVNAPTERADLPAESVDKIIFTSPSTVNSFIAKYQSIPASWTIVSKGPVTQQALREHNYESEMMSYG
ncbi:MAG: uroporphyrinogen-III C-methyltransferase [Candidatus Omnitrophica bacterium]|nr:uroporphyrinogen-III C-methyltransferase [Candidatus Omnitrophota bacterium]